MGFYAKIFYVNVVTNKSGYALGSEVPPLKLGPPKYLGPPNNCMSAAVHTSLVPLGFGPLRGPHFFQKGDQKGTNKVKKGDFFSAFLKRTFPISLTHMHT